MFLSALLFKSDQNISIPYRYFPLTSSTSNYWGNIVLVNIVIKMYVKTLSNQYEVKYENMSQWKQFLSNKDLQLPLGSGNFADVYLGTFSCDKDGNKQIIPVAIKVKSAYLIYLQLKIFLWFKCLVLIFQSSINSK